MKKKKQNNSMIQNSKNDLTTMILKKEATDQNQTELRMMIGR